MAPTKEMINLMKDMEKNIKDHMQKTIEQALKDQDQRLSTKIDEVFSKLDAQDVKIEEIAKSQNFLNLEFENIKQSVLDLKGLNIKAKYDSLQNEIESLKQQLIDQDIARDELDQYHRRDNLEFHGIPEKINENTNHIIKSMVKNLNIDLKDSDISTTHRLKAVGNKTPGIIVRFTNRDIRNQIFHKKRNLVGVRNFGIDGMTNLFINENLTPRKRKLFSMGYKKKSSLKYQFIWTKNGNIFVRKNISSESIKISSEADIDNLI